jgi:histidyl-tRNA synthetase
LADRSGARVAVIVGPDELAAATVSLRPLRTDGGQWPVPEGDIVAAVRAAAGDT